MLKAELNDKRGYPYIHLACPQILSNGRRRASPPCIVSNDHIVRKDKEKESFYVKLNFFTKTGPFILLFISNLASNFASQDKHITPGNIPCKFKIGNLKYSLPFQF